MRISDWSSDVCSSDLLILMPFGPARPCRIGGLFRFLVAFGDLGQHAAVPEQTVAAFDLASIHQPVADPVEPPGGRAASPGQPLGVVGYRAAASSYQGDRKSGVEGKGEEVRVNLGG